VRTCRNAGNANPALHLRDILAHKGLTAANGRMIEAAIDGFCTRGGAFDYMRDSGW